MHLDLGLCCWVLCIHKMFTFFVRCVRVVCLGCDTLGRVCIRAWVSLTWRWFALAECRTLGLHPRCYQRLCSSCMLCSLLPVELVSRLLPVPVCFLSTALCSFIGRHARGEGGGLLILELFLWTIRHSAGFIWQRDCCCCCSVVSWSVCWVRVGVPLLYLWSHTVCCSRNCGLS